MKADSDRHLSGLQRVCKRHGRMKCGDTVMVWDYARDVAVPEAEFKADPARRAASERARKGGAQ